MSAWLTLGRMVAQKILDFLPRLIMRWVHPPERLAAHIDVDVRDLDFQLHSIPHVYLWLRITNRSPSVDVQVDHVFVDIWD